MDKIKKFSMLSVKMEGVKCFKEPYEIKLDTLTYISGGNGQGKTTVADAIAYAFCGTPFWGEKSCDKLQNPDCKEMKVEVRFVDENGEIHTLSRKRNGNSSTVTMDALQIRQTDITNIFADKDVFLSMLNQLYFVEKIADGGREFLQKLMPPVSEGEVLNELSDHTKTLLENESLLDPEYYVKKKREELNEIDETCHYLEGQIDLLKTQRQEAEDKIDSVLEKGNEIVARKTALEEKQFDGIDVDTLKERQAKIAQSLSEDKKSRLLAKEAEIQNRQYVSKFAGEIAKTKADLMMLAEKYQKMMQRINGMKIGDVCPTCRTVISEENYKTMIDAMK